MDAGTLPLPSVHFSVDAPQGKDGRQLNPATKGSGRPLRFGDKLVVVNDNNANRKWARRVGVVAAAAMAADPTFEGPIELRLNFRMLRPKSAPRSRVHPIVKPDLDKLIRSVKDALTGIVYKDDAQIVSLQSWKQYAAMPGVDIEVVDISGIRR